MLAQPLTAHLSDSSAAEWLFWSWGASAKVLHFSRLFFILWLSVTTLPSLLLLLFMCVWAGAPGCVMCATCMSEDRLSSPSVCLCVLGTDLRPWFVAAGVFISWTPFQDTLINTEKERNCDSSFVSFVPHALCLPFVSWCHLVVSFLTPHCADTHSS